ncbi:MAG: hypothetical protein A3A97_01580 [Candidatus Terrybacteria bacterium RIFCSPLOWO2_01_FULL_40_23]|uniref:Uncharacterized protein n=1 Tax=Candidatus Terrybacteria bacterium RIFCSPLOWO2_01_FULL_40_23 TaxID=1802366 RepID=A0A1G2PR15_9BACT|nr:MAG: hypothetical protein A3A97_01580 [Candidatus Terrybacteria bacterium RIFCSPLOWO2_01_FULL_40_23]
MSPEEMRARGITPEQMQTPERREPSSETDESETGKMVESLTANLKDMVRASEQENDSAAGNQHRSLELRAKLADRIRDFADRLEEGGQRLEDWSQKKREEARLKREEDKK